MRFFVFCFFCFSEAKERIPQERMLKIVGHWSANKVWHLYGLFFPFQINNPLIKSLLSVIDGHIIANKNKFGQTPLPPHVTLENLLWAVFSFAVRVDPSFTTSSLQKNPCSVFMAKPVVVLTHRERESLFYGSRNLTYNYAAKAVTSHNQPSCIKNRNSVGSFYNKVGRKIRYGAGRAERNELLS